MTSLVLEIVMQWAATPNQEDRRLGTDKEYWSEVNAWRDDPYTWWALLLVGRHMASRTNYEAWKRLKTAHSTACRKYRQRAFAVSW